MQLDAAEPAVCDRLNNFFKACGHEDSDLVHAGWQMGRDCAHLSCGDMARTIGEDETNSIRTRCRREGRIFKVRIATDFDPHGSQARVTAGCSSSASAAPGDGFRIKDSPIRKAS
jgi:hypothetical protein